MTNNPHAKRQYYLDSQTNVGINKQTFFNDQPAAKPGHDESVNQKISNSTTERSRKLPNQTGKVAKILISLAVVAGIAWLAHGYISTRNQLENLAQGKSTGQTETEQLVSKIGNLVQLPTNETPTIATVNDASKLKSQAFFADAQNGDKVLIYSNSGKAVLFRPSSNKVVQYSIVNISNSTDGSGTKK